jgi:antitoxin PrlF
MNDRKLIRMQEKGQVTIPTEIRKKLGLKRGDLVAVMETPEGVFITPQQVVATKALDSIGNILKEQGLSLEEVISSGRELRTDALQETYGITKPSQNSLFKADTCVRSVAENGILGPVQEKSIISRPYIS